MNKLAIISGFLGAVKNRYMVYQEDRAINEKLNMASNVKNISGLELCYPADFSNKEELKKLLKEKGFKVSAINFRSRRTGKWLRGSFSGEEENTRKEVVEDLKKAMDLAVEFNCYRITTCPLNEGHDYIFEIDYKRALKSFEESIKEAALHNPEVTICIEYKWNDPRARCLLGNAGETLVFCENVGMPNVGVTLDFGHSIQAGERPAQSAAMLSRNDRLSYVHLNDNDKIWDWDMIPGAYNFWDNIEFLYYLKKLNYTDWIAYDVFPKEIDTVKNFNAVTDITLKLMKISDRLEEDKIEYLLKRRRPEETISYLYSII